MATVTHTKVSAVADGADTSVVRPSDWNANHSVALVDGDIPATIARDSEVTAAVDAHTNDATDAHDASAISVLDTNSFYVATDVEAALLEIASVVDYSTVPTTEKAKFWVLVGGSNRELWVNIGTVALPDWKTLNIIKNATSSGALAVTEAGIVSASGAAFEINAGAADHVGADILTGLADPTAGSGLPTTPMPALYIRRGGATELWRHSGSGDTAWEKMPTGIRNFSTADVVANAADTYLTGSALAVPPEKLAAGALMKWRLVMTKTAAGTAAPVWSVRIGTAGTTADTASLTFTGPAQTGAVDTGIVDIMVLLRNIGASGVFTGSLFLTHNLAATGFANIANPTLQAVSAAVDTTVANLIIGVSVNPGASGVWTHQLVSAELLHG